MRDIEIKNYTVPGKIDSNITLIGDLHYTKGMEEGLLSEIAREVGRTNSTVCFVGDILHEANIIDDEKHRNILTNFMKELSHKNDVKIILGDHDIMSKKDNEWVEDTKAIDFCEELEKKDRIEILDNKISTSLKTRNTFVGVNPGFSFYENKKEDKKILLKKLQQLKYIRKSIHDDILDFNKKNSILLMHSPYLSDDKEISQEISDYDLVLSGHMQNGVVPSFFDTKKGNKGIISPYNDILCDNARGYKVLPGNHHLIITGGLTKIAGDSKLKRFLNGLFPISIDKISIKEKAKKLSLYKTYIR